MKEKTVCCLTSIIAIYFVFIVGDAYYGAIDNHLFSINGGGITIRLILLQLLIGILSVIRVIQYGFNWKRWHFWSFLISMVNFLVVIVAIIVIQTNRLVNL